MSIGQILSGLNSLQQSGVLSPSIPFWDQYDFTPEANAGTGPGSTSNSQPSSFVSPPTQWDIARYGPDRVPVPGIVRILNCKPYRKVKHKPKYSSDGEVPTFLGYDVSRFDMEVILWTMRQMQAMQQMVKYVFPGKSTTPQITGSSGTVVGGDLSNVKGQRTGIAGVDYPSVPEPFTLYHPALALVGINTVFVEGLTPPTQYGSYNDVKVMHFFCWEYRFSTNVKTSTPKKQNQTPVLQNLLPGTNPGPLGTGQYPPSPLQTDTGVNYVLANPNNGGP